jgi:hypothetical protein
MRLTLCRQKARHFRLEKSPTVDAGVAIYSGFCCAYMGLGMKKEAMEIAPEGLTKFPNEDPLLYHNEGTTFLEMGWVEEAWKVVQKGTEKFPYDEELKTFLKDVENDLDDPPGGEILGLLLIVIAASAHKKLKKNNILPSQLPTSGHKNSISVKMIVCGLLLVTLILQFCSSVQHFKRKSFV